MKSIILFLVSAIMVPAFAQSSAVSVETPDSTATSTTQMPETKTTKVSARGIRVGFWLPNLITKTGDSQARRIDRTFGITAGYASLPVRRLGWIANAGLFEMTEYSRTGQDEDSISFARVDASLAFAVTSNFYLKAGGNVSAFTQKDTKENFEPGPGYQAGLGVQLTQNIGFEAGWLSMTQIGVDESDGNNFKSNGVDFGITGTF